MPEGAGRAGSTASELRAGSQVPSGSSHLPSYAEPQPAWPAGVAEDASVLARGYWGPDCPGEQQQGFDPGGPSGFTLPCSDAC